MPSGPHRVRNLAVGLAAAAVLLLVTGRIGSDAMGARSPAIVDGPLHALPVGVSFGEDLTRASPDAAAQALDQVVSLHATWIRIDLSWTSLEPSPGHYDWTALDRVMADARRRHLRVLGLLAWSVPWVRSGGCDTFTCPPADPATFATFAHDLVSRYPGDTLRAVEVWNEPNIAKFWPRPDPVAYGRLFDATEAAVHAVRPQEQVIVGGLAPNTQHRRGIVEAASYLRQACADHRCDGAAGVGFHPYTFPHTAYDRGTPPSSWQRMTQSSAGQPSLRSVMDDVGLSGVPVWVTEYGAPARVDDRGRPTVDLDAEPVPVLEDLQARIVSSGIRAASHSSDVGAIFIHTLRDGGVSGTLPGEFGLLRAGGAHKPAWKAFADAAARVPRD